MTQAIPCFIYKSSKKADTYLFVPDKDKVAQLPEDLHRRLGPLEFVMELSLTPERKLARTTGERVMQEISTQGFYLQLPPKDGQIFA